MPRSAPEGMVMPSMPQPTSTGGFVRHQGTFTGRITGDGSSGFLAEPGRYQLYASLACPWSQRALIVRSLLGLDRVIGLSLTDPISIPTSPLSMRWALDRCLTSGAEQAPSPAFSLSAGSPFLVSILPRLLLK